ncbi:MAG: ATP-binding cassette domain-containing protein, partial [Candidatus Rokuibacteriota bacterium]
MLEVERLLVAYGDATAIWDVSLTVGEGELVSVVGPNGSGKTTLINAIAGLLPVRSGRLRFGGEDLTRV